MFTFKHKYTRIFHTWMNTAFANEFIFSLLFLLLLLFTGCNLLIKLNKTLLLFECDTVVLRFYCALRFVQYGIITNCMIMVHNFYVAIWYSQNVRLFSIFFFWFFIRARNCMNVSLFPAIHSILLKLDSFWLQIKWWWWNVLCCWCCFTERSV